MKTFLFIISIFIFLVLIVIFIEMTSTHSMVNYCNNLIKNFWGCSGR
ncbi:MAG: hypothetical protein MJH09_13530 [Cetobacterium sp.]|nr:hypothetical protein [Cetobacterium ceti]MCJ8343843.1 hypothetical protein [Cetobacterium sp.]